MAIPSRKPKTEHASKLSCYNNIHTLPVESMVVKVVTDSSSDIPADMAKALAITVVPLYIRFGDEIFRDGVDISADEFYTRLTRERIKPKTSTPSPGDYADIYNRLAAGADGIVSIHLSPRYSSAIDAARLAREYVTEKCDIVVIDSRSVSMGCGLAVLKAARVAGSGAGVEQVINTTQDILKRTHIAGMISDIKYLLSGRRLVLPGAHLLLGRLGTILRFKLVGEVYEAGMVRGRGMYLSEEKALERLQQCVTDFKEVEEIAVLHAMKPDWAADIVARLSSEFPGVTIYLSRLSGATGVHGGPKAIAIAFTAGTQSADRRRYPADINISKT